MGKVVCFGEALIDLIGVATAPGRPPCYEQYAGGAPANVATAVARLGGEAEFIGMLAKDAFGDFLLASLNDAGVDTRHVPRTDAARTALAFVALGEGGERSFSFYRPPSADLLFRIEHFEPESFHDCSVFHACSNSLTSGPLAMATLAGMVQAREAGALVSFDVNFRPALWDPGEEPGRMIRKALALADVVKVSRQELDYLAREGEEAFMDALWQGHAHLLVVTDGPAPIRFHVRGSQGEVPAFPVTAIDTTAAGDAFVGAFLDWLVRARSAGRGLDWVLGEVEDGLRFAAACGALAVTRHGSFAAMPARIDADNFLREQA